MGIESFGGGDYVEIAVPSLEIQSVDAAEFDAAEVLGKTR